MRYYIQKNMQNICKTIYSSWCLQNMHEDAEKYANKYVKWLEYEQSGECVKRNAEYAEHKVLFHCYDFYEH